MALFDCTCEATSGHARALSYETAHGAFRTPMFMPVGTSATVKGVTTDQLRELGAQVVLANTYHLAMLPGADLVEEAGGIHRFMNYDGPMLTDSGGFQVFSLADTVKLSDDGVTFKSIYDGSNIHWTPEENMVIQQKIGADIAMQLDQCAPYPAAREFVAKAVDYSSAWARWPGPAPKTAPATSWAWATPPPWCVPRARAWTCSTACYPPAPPAWARRSLPPAA